MSASERTRSVAALFIAVAAAMLLWVFATGTETPAWASGRHADEFGSALFANDGNSATVAFLGEGQAAPDWSAADYSTTQSGPPGTATGPVPVADTPLGPLKSTGDGGQPNKGSTCSTAGNQGANGNCSTDGRGAPGSPQQENCSAVDGNGAGGNSNSCSSGGMGGSTTSHCSAGGPGTGNGDSASCSTGGTGTGAPGTNNGTCSAKQTQEATNTDCSTYDGTGAGGGSSHMSCSTGGNSTGGSCSVQGGGADSKGSAFCSVSGGGGAGGGLGNKCSVSGYPGGAGGKDQKCSVLSSSGSGSATCSVKESEKNDGGCTTINEHGETNNPGTCSAGNPKATGDTAEKVVCSVVKEDGSVEKPDPKTGICGNPHKHPASN